MTAAGRVAATVVTAVVLLAMVTPTPTAAASGARPGSTPASAATTAPPSPTPTPGVGLSAIPVWAYYYIWFDPSSWDRAKSDEPALGTYTSDERLVMKRHIELARAAGVDGFLVSWKEGGKLSERLARITEVAADEHFRLGLVYQGLDFARRPIEVAQVCADLLEFADRYATNPVFRLWGTRPVVVWTGTDQFSSSDQERCVAPVRSRLLVLASSRSLKEYERASSVFEGNAYYWSSVDPEKSWYPTKLAEMGAAVHATGGLWIAPAAPGFDARLVGGKTVVPRRDGRTLALELDAAVGSRADAIGLISWNEFTENSHVEPSRLYGSTALKVLAGFTGSTTALPDIDSSTPSTRPAASGLNGVAAVLVLSALLAGLLIRARWRREVVPPPPPPVQRLRTPHRVRSGR
ncbi:hypothetical protein [Oryzobacter telluris]|uniref:hypothetical protein n=1 Tax=Oryzobacter telluris TaxID=3149179 RepID=UPI00370D46E0